jgi:hypothetical protein
VRPVESVEGDIDHLHSRKAILASGESAGEQVHTEVKHTQAQEPAELHGRLAAKRVPGEVYRHEAVEDIVTNFLGQWGRGTGS